MKRIAVIALAWTGALALLGVALALLINSQAPGYEKVAKEEFGSPEAIRAIEKLYVRIETSPLSPELKIIPVFSPNPAYPTVRRIPKAWMPQEFPYWGAFHDMEIVEGTDVVAYYDSNKAFVAMEFLGTRYGCFISRDPNRCPPRFGTLQRLADNPLFVTSRIGLGPGDNGGN